MVKTRSTPWPMVLRIVLCLVLLGWVFQAIFLNEGRSAYERQGLGWDSLSRAEQWKLAWHYGPPELWRNVCLIDPPSAIWSLVFMGATIVLGTLRWRMVLRVHGINLSLGRAAEISLVAHFFNSFLLGSTGGDLMKAFYAARETSNRKTEAVVTVLVDRLIGLLSMLLFAAVMMIPNWALLSGHRRLAALAGIVMIMLIGALAVAGLSFWGGLSRRWPRARIWLRRLPKGELLERALEACRQFGQEPRFLVQAFALSTVLNVMCVLQIWVLARGLDLTIAPVALSLIVPVIICIAAMPVTPSGLGLRENIYVWMLAVPEINIPATQALLLSLLAYAGSLFWSLVGGLVYLFFRATRTQET
ncbi:MAG TPA: lysylphosphatidylglycerol synthase transmembrane domain-containing protein [Verrucomicrobiota bacterium]|nr:lysylphosphatidylglycerol synthase transmembrane domain-containing protein [Verrucomicrobiota bacterium]